MEYLEHDMTSVTAHINNNQTLLKEEVVHMAYKILCAIKFLHSANVIHRDITPSNILFDNQLNVRICDFGLSRTLPLSLVGPGSGNSKRLRDSLLKLENKKEIVSITDE